MTYMFVFRTIIKFNLVDIQRVKKLISELRCSNASSYFYGSEIFAGDYLEQLRADKILSFHSTNDAVQTLKRINGRD